MTPKEAADLVEAMPPVDLKNRLFELFCWQAKTGRALVHVGWYLHCLKEPKPKLSQEDARRLRELTKGIAKPVPAGMRVGT